MKLKWLINTTAIFLLIVVAFVGLASHDAAMAAQEGTDKIEGLLVDRFAADGAADFIVRFTEQADLSAAYSMDWNARGEFVVNTLLETATRSQANAIAILDRSGFTYQSFYAGNDLYVKNGDMAIANQLSVLPEVYYIRATRTYYIDPVEVVKPLENITWAGDFLVNNTLTTVGNSIDATTDWGITDTKADQFWTAFGVKGDGIKVANIDTGVQWNHPALVNQFACPGDPSNANCWSDPSNVCGGSACDNQGHGTHTMGTMVAKDDPSLPYIAGMAPNATWIACKGCETNSCSNAALISCAQWILQPGGNTANRPNVVNNSWGGGGGDTWYQSYVQAWVAAGIFPAFSAGNSGSSCSTLGSPGDYQESFASAAHDSGRLIASFSSRGPSAFGHDPYTKPNISAPGVSVCSSVPTNSWSCGYSGTSMASPHSAGAVALLWSCNPDLIGNIDLTFQALQNSANTPPAGNCGAPPDGQGNNTYGYGYLDVLAAGIDVCGTVETGTLEGYVYDQSNNPVEGATVTAQPAVLGNGINATTDPNGFYTMNLVVGTYDVTASKTNYTSQTITGVEVLVGQTSPVDFSLTFLGAWTQIALPVGCPDWTRYDAEYYAPTSMAYILGGRGGASGGDTLGDIYSFDPVAQTCADTGANMPIPISNYTIVPLNNGTADVFCTFGGRDASAGYTTAVQCYDPVGNTASTVSTLPGELGNFIPGGAAAVDNIAYVFSGFRNTASPYHTTQTWAYDPDPLPGTWTQVGDVGLGRGYIQVAVVDGKIYGFGGDIFDGANLVAQTYTEVFDPGTGLWDGAGVADLPTASGEGRAYGFDTGPGYMLDGQIVMAGGGQWPADTNVVVLYDINSDTYDENFPALNISRRNQAAFFVPGDPGVMWVIGGRSSVTGYGGDLPPYAPPEYYEVALAGPADIDVRPSSLHTTQPADTITTQTLQVCNVGGEDLTWALSEVPAPNAKQTVTIPAGPETAPENSAIASGPYQARSAGTYTVQGRAGIEAAPDVLLLVADNASAIQAILQAYGDLGAVVYYDARVATPSLAELQAYDVVLTWTDYVYLDPVGIGNVLADYVDTGGKVIDLMFAMGIHGWQMQGRFMDQGYTAMNGTSLYFTNVCLGSYNPAHPIMAGVTNVCEYYRMTGTYLTAGSTEVAQWSDGLSFVAVKNDQSVVSINGYVGDSYQWSGQMPDVVHNAILWLSGGVQQGIPWLSEDPIEGTVPPNLCTDVTVTFDSAGLALGDYFGALRIDSNDLDEPITTVPVQLTVALTPPNFDESYKTGPVEVFNNQPIHYTVVISNTGSLPGWDTSMVDPIPVGSTYVDGSVTCNSGTCTFDGSQILWNGQVGPEGMSNAVCTAPDGLSSDTVATPVVGESPAMGTVDQGTPKLPDTETQGPEPEALWPGPDGYGYFGSSVTFNWIDITGSGTPIAGLTDDNYVGPFPIGFTFNYYGTPWTDFYAGSNGFISFGAGSTSLSNQCPLPNDYTPDNLIAMLWDDLNFGTSGNAYYQTYNPCPIGTGACLVVEYYNTAHYGSPAGSAGTWEAVLSENGTVTLQYLDAGLEAGSGSTEGIEDSNFAADYGLTYACETASSVSDNTAFSFGVQAGIFLMPESVDAQGCAGVSQDHPFTVTSFVGYNTTVDLTYTILSGSGTCTGPASVDVSNGGSTPFVTTLTPVGAPGDLVVCQVNAVDAQNPDYNDTALINKTIVSGITEWQQIATEPNSGRMDNVTAGWDNKAWSITGYGSDANVRTYDPSSNTWTVVGTPAPFGNNYARSGCQVNDVVFIYGDASTTGFTGLWKYDMGALGWTNMTPSGTPPAQTGIWAPAWVYDPASGYCFMTGGATAPGAGNLTTTYVYDPTGNAWLSPLPNFMSVRDFHAAFIYDRPSDSHHMLCVVGGNNGVGLTSTQCFDFMTGAWDPENADMGALPGDLWGMGYAEKWHLDTEHQLWLVGGVFAGGLSNGTWYFDVNTGAWLDGGALESGAIYRTSAVTVNNDIYHLGGSTGGFTYVGLADHHVQMVCPVQMTNPVIVEFDVMPDPNTCDVTIHNQADITDPDASPVSVTWDTNVPCLPAEINKLGWDTAFYSDTMPYTITIDFPELVGTAILTDVIPVGTEYVNGSVSCDRGDCSYDPATNAVLWNDNLEPLPPPRVQDVLYDNGPLVTHPGGGYNGADASALQSALGLTIYGFGHQYLANNHMADDFVITDPGGWNINQITFFAYQTGAPTNPSPLTAVYYQIWNGPPDDPGSNVVFGDLTTNRLINTTWTNIYRVLDTALLTSNRAIFADVTSAGVTLTPGTYWIEWTTDGSTSYSGPWAPPISILGQTTTGNAKQNLAGTWAEAIDGTYPQGMPFIIEGTVAGPNPPDVTITFNVLVTSQGDPDPVINTAELWWNGWTGSAQWSTAIKYPEINLVKTVGTDPNSCATTGAIRVLPGTEVTYCYTAQNTGNVDLVVHDLVDSELGPILSDYPYILDPDESVSVTAPATIDVDTENTATWTAWADDVHKAVATDTASVTVINPQITLTKTVGIGPDCADTDSIRVLAGTEVTYCYTAQNTGDVDLTVHDLVDSELGPILTKYPYVLEPDASVSVTETATIDEDTENSATWTAYTFDHFTAEATDTASVDVINPALTLTKTVGIGPDCADTDAIRVLAGTEVTYCYTAQNTGDVDLDVHDLVDSELGDIFTGMEYVLEPDASVSVTETATIDADTENTATWTAYTEDGFMAKGTDSATVTVYVAPPSVDLGITKTDSPDPVYTGGELTYTLLVTNDGPDDATGVTVVDTLPAGVTFDHATVGCTAVGLVVTCDVGDLAADDTATITIVVMAPDVVGSITNSATVMGNEDDPDSENNTATAVTTVILPPVEKLYFYLPIVMEVNLAEP